MDDLELLVNGMSYAGWTSMAVTRAMDACSGAFTVSLTEKWEGGVGQSSQIEPWPILPGDECEVKLAGISLIKGYVDIFRPSYSATDHTINIQGRDKTSDLIDCSAVHNPDEWRNVTLTRFAETLAKPFGIKVKADADVGKPFDLCKLQQGETAFEAIQRYAKQRKLLVMPDGSGGLVITRAGRNRASVSLAQGENIKGASGSIDHSQRFSEYIVKAQSPFSELTDEESEAHIEGSVKDSGVKRYRPMLIIAEAAGNGASVTERATWEANVRIGKSASASITVQGWRQVPGGPLWEPNLLVDVRSPWLRLDGEMIIRQVTYERGEEGTTTTLDVVSPQAYAPEPPKGDESSGGGGNIWAAALGEDMAR